MGKTIWRYRVPMTYVSCSAFENRFTVTMPKHRMFLSVQRRETGSADDIDMWWVVDPDPDSGTEEVSFHVFGTGDNVRSEGLYLGTFQARGGALVFHLFEEGEGND